MKRIYKRIAFPLAVLVSIFLVQSCTKTRYDQLLRPYTEISKFTIAGYGELDSIPAVINNDSIIIYWNSTEAAPAKIKPTISVSTGATVSPASGTEVDFSESTVYTVTAEDGTVKRYILKPVVNIAIPVIFSSPASFRWGQGNIDVLGEYFLAAGDMSSIKVYAQRIKDGFEFDLTLDTANTTATKVSVKLPTMTAELDTGAHRIYIKSGNFSSNSVELKLLPPDISRDFKNIVTSYTISSTASKLKLRDSLKLKFNFDDIISPEMFEKFYPKTAIGNITVYLTGLQGEYKYFTLTQDEYSYYGNVLSIYLGNKFDDLVGYYFSTINVGKIGGELPGINAELIPIHDESGNIPNSRYEAGGTAAITFLQEGQVLNTESDLRINYTFSSNELKSKYAGKVKGITFYHRDVRSNSTLGGRFGRISIYNASITNYNDYVTFQINKVWKSTLTNKAIYAWKVEFESAETPSKLLYATIFTPDLTTTVNPN